MFQRMFGRPKRADGSEEPPAAPPSPPTRVDDGFVLLGPEHQAAPPSAASGYSLSGATAFTHSGSNNTLSRDDATDGVRVRVTVAGPGHGTDPPAVTAAVETVARLHGLDWDAFQYDFGLERTVLEGRG